MGSSMTQFPERILAELKQEVDVQHVDAYFTMKVALKKRKMQRYYKDIYCLIYKLGGMKPVLTDVQYRNCLNMYEQWMRIFNLTKHTMGRHSMPSLFVVLAVLLQKNGHEPYYRLPLLKDSRLLQNVFGILERIQHDGRVERLV